MNFPDSGITDQLCTYHFFQNASLFFLQPTGTKIRKTIVTKIVEAVKALALCHNVTPVYETTNDTSVEEATEADQATIAQGSNANPGGAVTYQASSPDEVALVEW